MVLDELVAEFEREPRSAELHIALRRLRAQGPERFDTVWRERLGPLPAWLTLDDAVYERCLEWLNAPSWAESKAFLGAHPELLAPVALDEIALGYPDNPTLQGHRELLAECARIGIDAAYEPLLLGELVNTWRAIEDAAEARRFLLDHRDEVATPRAASVAMANRDAVGHAVLGLAHEGETDLAYAILEDPGRGPEALEHARRGGRSTKLIALAGLVGTTDPALGYLHLAIGMVVGGEVDAAVDLLTRLPDKHPDAVAVIGDTIQHRPDHAVGLARLIGALSGADA